MLVNRPKKVIAKVGNYDIIISSDNSLENADKFDSFCNEFKMVIMAIVGAAKPSPVVSKPADGNPDWLGHADAPKREN